MPTHDVKRIVLTGGPCGGKTTALAKIREKLESLGYNVLIVPEIATIVIPNAALDMQNLTEMQVFQFQREMLSLQDAFEASFLRLSTMMKPSVIIHDRGLMDPCAFLSPEMWQALLNTRAGGVQAHRDMYDAVIHIRTAAHGAEKFYTLDNNAARTETPEQARAIDDRILKAWTGTPHLRVVDNDSNFDDKVQRILNEVLAVVGEPHVTELERKYLVHSLGDDVYPHTMVDVEIEQRYLTSPDDVEARIRNRGGVYTHCEKRRIDELRRIEKERIITPRQYFSFMEHVDSDRNPIYKTRTCFVWHYQYFELDRFHRNLEGLKLLEIELRSSYDEVKIPDWIDVVREVTDDYSFSNYQLSEKGRTWPST